MEKIINEAKKLARLSEIKIKLGSKKAEKEVVLLDLGKKVYETYPNINLEEIKDFCNRVHDVENEMADLNQESLTLMGLRKCPCCNVNVKTDMKFCPQCGAKLELDPKPEETSDKETIDDTAPDDTSNTSENKE